MLNAAILGFGVVGGGVADVIALNKKKIEEKLGREINVKYILDLRDFPDSPYRDKVVHDFETIKNDGEIDVAVEAMGGLHPAYDFTKALLEKGVSVVTSNKHVVAEKGYELLDIAAANGSRYLFEASVGGGIPILDPLRGCLSANGILRIDGILNGTTNYILDEMIERGLDFETALSDAKAKGYAEADPSADVDGIDAKRKICILNAMATGVSIDPSAVYTRGIRDIMLEDVRIAAKAGYSIKLIGHCDSISGRTDISVEPRLVPYENLLSSVNGVYNAIKVVGNACDDLVFTGRGAGKMPTASAVVGDIMNIAQFPNDKNLKWTYSDGKDLIPEEEKCARYYVRVLEDEEEVGLAFGNAQIVSSSDGECAFITEKIDGKTFNKNVGYFASEPVAAIKVLE